MNTLSAIWNNIIQIASVFNFPWDLVDILIVAFVIYEIFSFARSRAAVQIIRVVVALLIVNYISVVLNLNMLNYLLGTFMQIGLIALVVVFQPELRRLMERLGSTSLRGLFGKTEMTLMQSVLNDTVSACMSMSRDKIGALIVFERTTNLEDYFRTGTVLDAEMSEELLKNIFFPKAALHDGAVIIRNERIAAAGCVLPLTENPNLSRDLGTRHRASIGITEHSDAVVVVVSEETGMISTVNSSVMQRGLTENELKEYLTEHLSVETMPVQSWIIKIYNRLKEYKKEDLDEQ